jgi:hypothetical protein
MYAIATSSQYGFFESTGLRIDGAKRMPERILIHTAPFQLSFNSITEFSGQSK